MSNPRSGVLAVPGEEPNPPQPSYAFRVGMLSTFATTFVGLVGHGYAPRDALVMTIVVFVGGAEIIRRLPGGGNNEPGGPRWA